ncbi:MAG: hypothetical protein HY722_15055 [Planctomycetes bacterium]|nr:hypothetical protein [Planctomycetota bacterium]
MRPHPILAAATGLAMASLAGCAGGTAFHDLDTSRPVLESAGEVERRLSRLRGLPFRKPVEKGTQDEKALRGFLEEEFARELPPEERRDASVALAAVGLLPPGYEMDEGLLDLLVEQVAGYYDPRTERFQIVEKGGGAGVAPSRRVEQRFVLSHELTHALQDQHFDLEGFLEVESNEDEAVARKSLVEGEAMVLALDEVLFPAVFDARTITRLSLWFTRKASAAMMNQEGYEELARAPRYLRENLLFQYTEGASFALAVRDRLGWRGVDEAYADPPRSTEQVLHPVKYLDQRDTPWRFAMPDLGPMLPEGAREVGQDTLGELNTRLVFDEHTGEGSGLRASRGWGGDRYSVWELGEGGPTVLAWATRWDTGRDAREFVSAYVRLAAARWTGSSVTRTIAGAAWESEARRGRLLREGNRVTVVEGPPLGEVDLGRIQAALAAGAWTREEVPVSRRLPAALAWAVDHARLATGSRTSLLLGLGWSHLAHRHGYRDSTLAGLGWSLERNRDLSYASIGWGTVFDYKRNRNADATRLRALASLVGYDRDGDERTLSLLWVLHIPLP